MDFILIAISIMLIISILLQQRGGGASAIFGGGQSGFYGQRRGLERVLFFATILLAVSFLGISLFLLIGK